MAQDTLSGLTASLPSQVTLPPSFQRNPKAALGIAVAALSISIPTLIAAVRNYRGYIAIGPGGLPHNVVGWSIQGILQLFASWDTRDPRPFRKAKNQKPYGPHGTESFWGGDGQGGEGGGGVPRREGERPDVPGYVAPQRQMTQQGSEDMRGQMIAFLDSLATKNPGILTLKPSGLEGIGTPALWLNTSGPGMELPGYMRGIKGEVTHVHPEASSHVTVSMKDAEELVTKGWAERHRLSGWGGYIPWSYIMVYAPRDEGELEVWKSIVRAGVRFVTAGSGREVSV